MADAFAQEYRTREDEEQTSQEKNKVRFADISLTAAWIAASYQAFSPEQIRKDIQQEWVKSITKEVSKDQKFKDLYATRQRGENRHAYDSRRMQQVEIRRAISDLVGAHGDQLFEKGLQTQAFLKESAKELIQNDYQGLANKQEELLAAIASSQTKLADTFKKQNSKNNQRFKKSEQLQEIANNEKAQHHAEVISRRELKQELTTKTDPKEQQQAITQSQISQKALARVLAGQNPSDLNEAGFLQAYRAEFNKELYDKRGHKRYKIDQINEERILKLGKYYSRYFSQVPASTLPKPINKPLSQPITTSAPTPTKPFSISWPKWQFNFPRIDWSGLNSLFRSTSPQVGSAISGGLGNFAGFLSKLPGIGGFFGGSTVAGATAAGGTAAATVGGATAAGGLAAAAPIVLIIGLVVFLLILIMLVIFNNPVSQPQAIIQTTITPTPII